MAVDDQFSYNRYKCAGTEVFSLPPFLHYRLLVNDAVSSQLLTSLLAIIKRTAKKKIIHWKSKKKEKNLEVVVAIKQKKKFTKPVKQT